MKLRIVRPKKATLPAEKSPGEEAFWLHCRVENLSPKREYHFHPKRKFRFDFYFPDLNVAVEVDGRGRHQTYSGFEDDCYKYNSAAKMGIRVLRYTTAMVLRGDAINDVLEMLK